MLRRTEALRHAPCKDAAPLSFYFECCDDDGGVSKSCGERKAERGKDVQLVDAALGCHFLQLVTLCPKALSVKEIDNLVLSRYNSCVFNNGSY